MVKNTAEEQFPENFYSDPRGLDRYVVQEKFLFSWDAPSKIVRTWKRSEYMQVVLVVVIFGLILLLLGEAFLAVLVVVLTGLLLLSESTPPSYLKCHITTLGVKVDDTYYFWPDCSQFWFEDKGTTKILYLRHFSPIPHRVKIIIFPQDEEKIKVTIGTYLLYKQPKQSKFEKAWKKLTASLPFDLDLIER